MEEQHYLSHLDEHLRDVQELKRLAQKPEILALMKQMLKPSWDASIPTESRAEQQVLEPITKQERRSYGGLLKATEEACRSFGSETYLVKDVVSRMLERRYEFMSKRKDVAVNGALKTLVGNDAVVIVEQGIGSNPTKYKNRSAATVSAGFVSNQAVLTQ